MFLVQKPNTRLGSLFSLDILWGRGAQNLEQLQEDIMLQFHVLAHAGIGCRHETYQKVEKKGTQTRSSWTAAVGTLV